MARLSEQHRDSKLSTLEQADKKRKEGKAQSLWLVAVVFKCDTREPSEQVPLVVGGWF